MSSATETAAAPKQRTTNGRFAPGNSGGPGNPFGRQVAELRKALLNRVSPEKIGALIDSIVEKAMHGDVGAAKLVLQYTLGKPAAAVEPDRVEIEDYNLRAESAVPAHVWGPMLQHLPAGRVNEIAGVCGPMIQSRILEPIVQTMNGETPTRLSRTARKAMRREMRRLRREAAPSPNRSNGSASKRPADAGRKASAGPNRADRAG